MLFPTSVRFNGWFRHAIVLAALLVHFTVPDVFGKMIIRKVQCDLHNSTLVHLNECRIRLIRRGMAAITVNATILRSIRQVHVNAALTRKSYSSYMPFLFNRTIDACAFYNNRKNPVANLIFQVFEKQSTLNHSCPYEGVQYVKDLQLENNIFDAPITHGDYVLNLTWLFYRKKVISTAVLFEFETR